MIELDFNTAKFLLGMLTRKSSGLTEDEISSIRSKLYDQIGYFYPDLITQMLTPTNEELKELAKNNPPPSEWFKE